MLADDGLFNDLDPMDRLALSESVADMGQSLLNLLDGRRLDVPFQPVAGRMVYFAPCHQRKQKIAWAAGSSSGICCLFRFSTPLELLARACRNGLR